MDCLNDAQEQEQMELRRQEMEMMENRRLTEQMHEFRETTVPAPSATSSFPTSPPTLPPPAVPFSPQTFSALSPPNPVQYVYWVQSMGYQPNSHWTSSSWHQEVPQSPPSSAYYQFTAPAQSGNPVLRSLRNRFGFIEVVDLNAILGSEEQTSPSGEKRKADLIVSTKQYHDWTMTGSSELLVHGEFNASQSASGPFSALSAFCARLMLNFRRASQPQSALVFFCGRHIEHDDHHRGPGAMICSFMAQLATVWPFENMIGYSQFNTVSELDFEELVKDENLPRLCELFGCLVRLLPQQTLICVIDGVSHYETEEFEGGLLYVLGFLLSLARNRDAAVTVKVLVTSPTRTDQVQHQFRNDDSSFISLVEIL